MTKSNGAPIEQAAEPEEMTRHSSIKSTTAARNSAASPPYSTAATPRTYYGIKRKNAPRTFIQSQIALAIEELELHPLPGVDSGAGSHEGSQSMTILFPYRYVVLFILTLSSKLILLM